MRLAMVTCSLIRAAQDYAEKTEVVVHLSREIHKASEQRGESGES